MSEALLGASTTYAFSLQGLDVRMILPPLILITEKIINPPSNISYSIHEMSELKVTKALIASVLKCTIQDSKGGSMPHNW